MKLEDDNKQTLASRKDGDKFTQLREDMSLSSSPISMPVRFQQKLVPRKKGEEMLRINEMGEFLTITTQKRLRN